MSFNRLRVGLIGCGEVAQVIHLPTLQLLNHLYRVVAICDVSQETVDFCKKRYDIQKCSVDAYKIINDPEIDVVFNLTTDAYHELYTTAALKAGKHVMQEKPLTLSIPSAERMIDAERSAPNGARIFVGYMRRYAPSFLQAFKREIKTMDRIHYARCRGIIGPNAHFVGQSGTSPIKATDVPPASQKEQIALLDDLMQEAFEGKEVTKERKDFCRFLGSLGSHDLSLMREALGPVDSVSGVSCNDPFYSAMLNFNTCNRFTLTYETGIDAVPRFDSHLTVYGEKKTVSIEYDTPFVKGLPIKVKVDEANEYGEMVSRVICSSYEDTYTAELKEMHACFTEGKPIKTSARDALEDLKLFKMLYDQYEKQESREVV